MYLIDTDILIDFFKAKYRLNDKIKAVGLKNCYVSEITIAEITYGASKSSDVKKELKNVNRVKSNFKVLPITDVLDLYSQERLRLEKAGTRVPDFDLLIGVTSVANNFILVTGNEKHHSRIKGVIIENWRRKEDNEFLP
jgi:tRNA(fMet)-specific endonuclease VapC